MSRPRTLFLIALSFLFLFWIDGAVLGQVSPQVQATLSSEQIAVGETAILEIVAIGSTSADIPSQIEVDGLEIVPRGQATQVQIFNFHTNMRVSRSFEIRALREGDFLIPSIRVRVGRQIVQTQPMRLRVEGYRSGGNVAPIAPAIPRGNLPGTGMPNPPALAPQPQQPGSPSSNAGERLAWMELIVPQGPIYVGQKVPVELRLYLDQRFQFDVTELSQLTGEGFVAERFSEPQRRTEVRNGISYEVATLQTTLSPVKAGNLQIPPIRAKVNVLLPRQMPGGSIWEDFFGMDPFRMFGNLITDQREFTLDSNGIDLEVMQPPREEQPADFAGAIGQFQIRQRVEPTRAEVGEPMKLIIEISGSGNFNAIGQPELENTEGWRVYSGSDSFQALDALGYSGKKAFEVTIVPQQDVTLTPSAKFSFFDPLQKKYITLRAEQQPVWVRGGRKPAPVQPTPQLASQATTSSATPTNVPDKWKQELDNKQKQDEKVEKAEFDWEPALVWNRASFVAVPLRIEFLVANGAALISLLVFATGLLAKRMASGESAQIARIRGEQTKILNRLCRHSKDSKVFFGEVWEILRREAELRANFSNHSIADVRSLVEEAGGLPAQLREEVQWLLTTCDEARFASRSPYVSQDQQAEVIRILREVMRTPLRRDSSHNCGRATLGGGVRSAILLSFFTTLFWYDAGLAWAKEAQKEDKIIQKESEAISNQAENYFEMGLDAFAKGDCQTAGRNFELALEKFGTSAEIYYNLGLVRVKEGQIGSAVLNFLRALFLNPTYSPARRALEQIAREREILLPKRNLPQEAVELLGSTTIWIASAVFFWLSAFGILIGVANRRRVFVINGVIGLMITALIAYAAWFGDPLITGRNWAVIDSAKAVALRITPNESAGGVESLPPGSFVQEETRRGRWAFVKSASGKRGWVPVENLVRVIPTSG